MDFYFQNDHALNLGTPTQKFENNVAAIRLAKELTASGRVASSEEQAILSRYVGWGDSALLRQFTASNEIDKLLTADEMRAARASSLNAHYTALPVIGAMWDALTHLGFGRANAYHSQFTLLCLAGELQFIVRSPNQGGDFCAPLLSPVEVCLCCNRSNPAHQRVC